MVVLPPAASEVSKREHGIGMSLNLHVIVKVSRMIQGFQKSIHVVGFKGVLHVGCDSTLDVCPVQCGPT